MDKITHEVRLSHWTELIRQCHGSGQTIRSWCADNNVGEKQFYYWQRRVRKQVISKPGADLPAARFVELSTPVVQTTPPSADITLRAGDLTIEINNTAAPRLIESILKVLAHVK